MAQISNQSTTRVRQTTTGECERPSVLELSGALERAANVLAAQQREDGSFEDPIDVGPVVIATELVLEHVVGRLSSETRAAGLSALCAAQLDDGSFQPFPCATEGSASVTALAIAAFELAGFREPALERARTALERLGGMRCVIDAFRDRGDMTALFLAASRHVGPEFLPDLPLSLLLVPRFERLIDGRVHAGNLIAFVVLGALSERLGAKHDRRGSLFGRALGGALRGAERQRATAYLGAWQNPDGGVNQALFPTQLVVLGLWALEIGTDHPQLARSLDWLDRQKSIDEHGRLRMQAIPNDVWSTALAVLALDAAGRGQGDPATRNAVVHLLGQQHDTPQPRANQRRRGACRTGGWAFQRGNPTMPDCDDTGLVLAALGSFAGERCSRDVFDAIARGVAWLRDMQNPNGGFPAYVWNLPNKPPGPMFLRDSPLPDLTDPKQAFSMLVDPPAWLGDPATEGVTARVLWGLGKSGLSRNDPLVCQAIGYLKSEQCGSGAFWDRWMTCYLPGTATVLLGLKAVGEDMGAGYVRRAVEWMGSCQNSDGGFGETSRAFRDPLQAGRGHSMPAVTAFVVCALIDAGEADSEVVTRAVSYLLRARTAEGTWLGHGWVNPYVPPDTFYSHEMPSRTMPIVALARYLDVVETRRSSSGYPEPPQTMSAE